MRRFLCLLLLAAAPASLAATRVTMLHFSDYHSHALPFFSEGKPDQGGIARALGYMEREKKRGALVFNGGDMINKGSPAWSDKYTCREWPWFNGIVDAMAFGNHDPDYGREEFDRCAAQLQYPVLSANTAGLKPYAIFERGGVRIGVFALAGRDFATLVKSPGFTFSDPVEAARAAVKALRETEHADVVVMIGHEHTDEDYELARSVPGIDVIFGSHSHFKQQLTKIDGTATWFISPFQYLTYVSRVEVTVDKGKVRSVTGGLVPVTAAMAARPFTAKLVAEMQRGLEDDPKYAELFKTIGSAKGAILVDGQNDSDAPFGNLVMDAARAASGADVALSTASSFRQSLPPGTLTMEDLRGSLPYDNEILIYQMSGEQLSGLLQASAARRGTDNFLQLSGVRLALDGRTLVRASLANGEPVDPKRIYRVAVTDYLARVSTAYRDLFAGLAAGKTNLRVRDETRKFIGTHSPVAGESDGRIGGR